MDNNDPRAYCLTQKEIKIILDQTLDHIFLLRPKKTKEKVINNFMEYLFELKHLCPNCKRVLDITGNCELCSNVYPLPRIVE